jgi:hypothetical protein
VGNGKLEVGSWNAECGMRKWENEKMDVEKVRR